MMAAVTLLSAVMLNSGCASSRRMTRNSRFSEEANLQDKSSAAINYKSDLRGDVTGTQVNAWPLCYVSNRFVSVLWPVYDHDDRGMAIRPFYNRDDKEYSILFPLSAWNPENGDGWVLSAWWLPENRYGVWPFFSRNAAPFALSFFGENSYHILGPLGYWQRTNEKNDGKNGNMLFLGYYNTEPQGDEVKWGIFPFVAERANGNVDVPIILSYWHAEKKSGFILPVLTSFENSNSEKNLFTFPLYFYQNKYDTQESMFISLLGGGGWQANSDDYYNYAMPLYWFSNSKKKGSTLLVPGLLSYLSRDSGNIMAGTFPLYSYSADENSDKNLFFSLLTGNSWGNGFYKHFNYTVPLYFYSATNDNRHHYLLTLLGGGRWGEGESNPWGIVGNYYWGNDYSGMFPLYHFGQDKKFFLPGIAWWDNGQSVVILNTYWTAKTYGCMPLFHVSDNPDDINFALPGIFWWNNGKDGWALNTFWSPEKIDCIPFFHYAKDGNQLSYALPGVFWWNEGKNGWALNSYWSPDSYGSIPFFHRTKNVDGTNYIFPGIFWWNSGNNGWALNFSWDKSKKEYEFLPFYAQDRDSTWVFPCFFRKLSAATDPETNKTVMQTKSVWAFNSYYRKDDFHGSFPFYHWSEEDKYLLPGIFWGGSATSSYQFFLPILSGWWNSGNFPYANRKAKDNGYYYLKSGWMAGLLAGYEYEICLSIKDEGNVSLGQDIIKDIPEAEFTKDNPQITEYFNWRENYAVGGWPFGYEWNSENNDFELYSFTPLNYIQRENNRYSIMGISSLLYHQENHSYNEFSLALLGLLYYRDADYTVQDNNRRLQNSKWCSFIFLAGGEATEDEAHDHVLWYLYRHKRYGQNSVTSIFPFMSIRDNEDSTEFSWIWDGFMSLKHSETSGYSGRFLFLPF